MSAMTDACIDKSYIGDGVYAGRTDNGTTVVLWLSAGCHDHSEIALKPEVQRELVRYLGAPS